MYRYNTIQVVDHSASLFIFSTSMHMNQCLEEEYTFLKRYNGCWSLFSKVSCSRLSHLNTCLPSVFQPSGSTPGWEQTDCFHGAWYGCPGNVCSFLSGSYLWTETHLQRKWSGPHEVWTPSSKRRVSSCNLSRLMADKIFAFSFQHS